MRFSTGWIAVAGVMLGSVHAGHAVAQRADVAIELERSGTMSKESADALTKLREDGKALTMDQARKSYQSPSPKPVTLPVPSVARLEPTAIAAKARVSYVRVGWHYLCKRCEHWHTNLAGGYVIAEGGIAVTCEHVLSPNPDMREGFFIAQSASGAFHPVTSVLAVDADLDAAVIQLGSAQGLPPLPLNDQVAPGDAAYLLSDPKGRLGYFSAGMVNRFYWDKSKPGDPTILEDARRLRINFSTDWAPGSSGAAVLDQCGNVIGHVSKIATEVAPMRSERSEPPATAPTTRPDRAARPPVVATQIVFHEGIPARGVMLLIKQINAQSTPATDASQAR